jgi:hypothetical protein
VYTQRLRWRQTTAAKLGAQEYNSIHGVVGPRRPKPGGMNLIVQQRVEIAENPYSYRGFDSDTIYRHNPAVAKRLNDAYNLWLSLNETQRDEAWSSVMSEVDRCKPHV